MTARIALHGATGRMGRAITQVIAEEEGVALAAAFAAPDDPALGRDAGAQVVDAGDQPRVLGGGVTSLPGAMQFSSTGSHLAFLSGYAFAQGVGELRLAKLSSGETETLGDGVTFYAFSSDGPARLIDVDIEWRADQGADIALGDIARRRSIIAAVATGKHERASQRCRNPTIHQTSHNLLLE